MRLGVKSRLVHETPDAQEKLRAWLREHPVPPRPGRRPTVEDWERLGYRVTEWGEAGRTIEPITPTPGQRYLETKRTLVEHIWKRGIPRPAEYAEWYTAHKVAELQQARFPELLHCVACGKPIQDKQGNFVVQGGRWFPKTGQLVADPPQQYCSGPCRNRGKRRKWRARYPEKQKMTR